MASTILDESTIQLIRGRFEGELLEPGDDGYDEARTVFNAMIDRKPRLIVVARARPTSLRASLLARETGLPLAIKGGGHGVNGHAVCDDGIMLDLSPMKRIDVDPEARVARAQAGVTWGEFDAATRRTGSRRRAAASRRPASPASRSAPAAAGSSGCTASRRTTCIAAEVVTADGRVVRASEDENADLFWGLRGGGGNFGVVTQFEYRLHEVGPMVTGGMVLWPLEQAGDVVRFYRDWIESAPDEVGGGAAIVVAPPEPFVPAELQGKPVVACHPDLVSAIPELLRVRSASSDRRSRTWSARCRTSRCRQLLDSANQPGNLNYWKAEAVQELSDELIDLVVAHGSDDRLAVRPPAFFQPLGGALARIRPGRQRRSIRVPASGSSTRSASGWREARRDREMAWVRKWGEITEPYARAGVPLTFSADTGDERVRATFGAEKYARLVALKDKYDPENLFRLNQNIKPS